ncbi:MAG: FMN-binding protein, partial [Alphaproteobacteria bacterium]
VEEGALREVAVLVYRESRGGEIRYPYFRDQFVGARLGDDLALDADIDGISGATLSVHAMQRMARLALYLDGVARGETAR